MFITSNVLKDITDKTTADQEAQSTLEQWLSQLQEYAPGAGLDIGHDKAVVIGIHVLAYVKRLEEGEYLPEIPDEMLTEISPQYERLSRKLLKLVPGAELQEPDTAEIFYLAVHFEAVKANMGGN
ncbi:hypothetical protein OIN60_16460 [Paenibacillus sp. P96]|uniref:PRD domain-containing protein n=1 Tax=Paenibacillus zeirhizosphaerae TaxID=2987519 RepID=A0ABT9FUH8_9BACL|nr:hypothetical protein [Paenibacillus sp. P96]MDP4098350.1 hypothetical protein [Paenibacillus sp. P96]